MTLPEGKASTVPRIHRGENHKNILIEGLCVTYLLNILDILNFLHSSLH